MEIKRIVAAITLIVVFIAGLSLGLGFRAAFTSLPLPPTENTSLCPQAQERECLTCHCQAPAPCPEATTELVEMEGERILVCPTPSAYVCNVGGNGYKKYALEGTLCNGGKETARYNCLTSTWERMP